MNGGGSGIRTRVTVSRKHTFQACAFNHSATPPNHQQAHAFFIKNARYAPSITRPPLRILDRQADSGEGLRRCAGVVAGYSSRLRLARANVKLLPKRGELLVFRRLASCGRGQANQRALISEGMCWPGIRPNPPGLFHVAVFRARTGSAASRRWLCSADH